MQTIHDHHSALHHKLAHGLGPARPPFSDPEDPGSLSLDVMAKAAQHLLMRPLCTAPVLDSTTLFNTSLVEDIDFARTPGNDLSDALLANIAAKYFYAYIHPRHTARLVTVDELRLAFDQFANRRKGAVSLAGHNDLRRDLLRHGFALAMCADIPKTVAILRDICERTLPAPQPAHTPFTGLDIGAGTGILMLAQSICAARNGYTDWHIVGIERDTNILRRTQLLTTLLGCGSIHHADAKKTKTYTTILAELPEPRLTFVSNETIPGKNRRLWKEDFIAINYTLYSAIGHALQHTAFFPQALIARSRKTTTHTLHHANSFGHALDHAHYPLHLMTAHAIVANGQDTELDQLGLELAYLVHPEWHSRIATRW